METSPRETKRMLTALRLNACALTLTAERGYDGWTMDDLAEVAGVSRRTVFNYFPGKAEVVLGPEPRLDEASLATFLAGGPTGALLDDLVVLAEVVVAESGQDHATIAANRAVILGDPRLLGLVHERWEQVTAEFADLILQREGEAYGAAKALLLVRLVSTVFDSALERIEGDPDRPFSELFAVAVDDARSAFAD